MACFQKAFFASDHGGVALRSVLLDKLGAHGIQVEDLGVTDAGQSVDYPAYGKRLAEAVAEAWSGGATNVCGILLCGSGIGMSMAANRVPGVRAALVSETTSATLCREHNNANVLCLGARIIGPSLAEAILETFLTEPFAGGRHQRRVDMMG